MAGRWVDVGDAARKLDISTDAVRKRIARGSLKSDRPNGNVLVWLDDSGMEAGREAEVDHSALVEAKEQTIRLLEEQLRLRAEEIQRRDVIISQLTQATSNLTDRMRELEAPQSSEEGAEHRSNPGGPQEVQEQPFTEEEEPRRRSWWREFFGLDG